MDRIKAINDLDIIAKGLAILTSLLVFLGIISSVVYYRAFSINILDNISIGEALILFVAKFTPLAISFICGFLISSLFSEPQLKKDTDKESKPESEKTNTLSFWQKLYVIFVISPLFLLSFMGFLPFVLWILPLSFIIRLYVLSYIVKRMRLYFQYKKIESKVINYIQIAGISIIIIATIAMTEAYLTYSGKTGKIVTLHFSKGEVMKTDANTLYLGKSQSFYYLYNKIDKKAIIIKADQIGRMDIEKE